MASRLKPSTTSTMPTYITHMNGTSTPATEPIRLMPPMMTIATRMARIRPVIYSGMSVTSRVMSPTLHAWNIFPPVTADTSSVRQKSTPMNLPSPPRPHSLRPLATTNIGPPCGLSGSDVSRKSIDCVTSVLLSAMPTKPTIHIQNTAPGPPIAMAIATPAILPRPTVAESAAESA